MVETTLFSFKAFLSHRYKSPDINLYFFQIFSDIAEVQFEVDQGTFSTNVTRLERMVRDSDAFIGIYPFPGSSDVTSRKEELIKESQYFRLELDLAIRSQKPAIIFYDQRFDNIIEPPDNILSIAFDANEITGSGESPSEGNYSNLFSNFCKIVKSKKDFNKENLNIGSLPKKTKVGIVVPAASNGNTRYTPDCINLLKSVLKENNYSDKNISMVDWPPVLARDTFSIFEELDVALVDLSEDTIVSGIVAYMHGRFVPMIRLRPENEQMNTAILNMFDNFLYGGVEVGYKKDMLLWDNIETLEKKLVDKLERIKSPVRRINTKEEAVDYFREASLRKEAVFLSYSGKDIELASKISKSLKKYFQKVFDYKDGESISIGEPWLKEIFDQLSTSAVGINLLSQSYIDSGNCTHEAQEMVARRDSNELILIPVKLYDNENLKLPSYIGNLQYLRLYEYKNEDELSKKIVEKVREKEKK